MRNNLHIPNEKNCNGANDMRGNLLSLSTYSTMTEIPGGTVFACIPVSEFVALEWDQSGCLIHSGFSSSIVVPPN